MAKDNSDTRTVDAFPAKRGRGRPKKADALSNADRQARFKQKKRDEAAGQSVSHTGDSRLDAAFARPGFHERESARNLVLICALRQRNSQHAELIRRVQILEARLRNAGVPSDVSQGFKGKAYHWNEDPPVDYRPTDPRGDHTDHPDSAEADFWQQHDWELTERHYRAVEGDALNVD